MVKKLIFSSALWCEIFAAFFILDNHQRWVKYLEISTNILQKTFLKLQENIIFHLSSIIVSLFNSSVGSKTIGVILVPLLAIA